MAEAVLFNIAEGIISKLGSLAIEEIALWWGLKDEIEKLKTTVSTIKGVLLDAEKQSSESHQVKGWLGQLKEAVYDADDLLDDFATEVLRRQVMSGNKTKREVQLFFSSSNRLVYGFKMADKIKHITARLDGMAKNRNFHLVQQPREAPVMTRGRDQTHSILPENFIGREDDKKVIIDLLLSSNIEENVSIISIVGIGGLGKTTLAQSVCNDNEIKNHFELNIWVCVSNNFDVKLIVEKMLESITSEQPKNREMDALVKNFNEKTGGKNYLIVLDDVWNEDSELWFSLRNLLVLGAKGSKIIVTTRLKKVAEMIRSIRIYELQGLGDNDSWSLFKQLAFRQGQVSSPTQETIGKEILAKCVGVPLAIKTIGSLLYFKETESEWLSFKNMEFSRVDQNERDIIPTLRLSYNHLPSHLKHCFAYCRLFPKDHKINVKKLISHWMGQGYIKLPDNSSQSLEDIGLEYFKELAWRSFFQEVEKDSLGNVSSCKMHDLMHDLAMQVAGDESILLDANVKCVDENARHASLGPDLASPEKILPSLLKAKKLRTLFFLNRCMTEGKGEWHLIFSKLRCLRVLDLHHTGIKVLPRSIARLKNLRCLDLSENAAIERLPDTICRLQNLQVLNLKACWNLKQLPKGMTNLVNLMELQIEGCDALTHMPPKLGQLTCLKQLSRFVVAKEVSKHCSGLSELQRLKNLTGMLEIVNLKYVRDARSEFKAANLKDMLCLQTLTLAWKEDIPAVMDLNEGADFQLLSSEDLRPHVNLKELKMDGGGRMMFPSWLSCLTNLVTICIHNFDNCQYLPPLQRFPSLKSLEIRRFTNLEYIDCQENINGESSSSFHPLMTLTLLFCPNLKGWRRISSSMIDVLDQLPKFNFLSELIISTCPNLTSVPPFPSLKNLTLQNVSIKLLEQIMKVSLNSLKLSFMDDLEFLPDDWLHSLKRLAIEYCPRLRTLPQAMRHLTSLEYFHICNCEELNLSDDQNSDGMHWQNLKSLRYLQFWGLPKLVSLPLGLQQVPTLIELTIIRCPNMTSFPEWMRHLNLFILRILECPQLSERCRNNMALDWPNIAHIPNIHIDDINISFLNLGLFAGFSASM